MGTVLQFNGLDEKLREVRSQRYACQSVARKALPNERVSSCLRSVLNKTQVEVWKHLKTEKAFFNGLAVCGSIWNCPVCAAKISERRRLELKQAFDMFKEEKLYIAMLTLTFSHKRTDKLKDTLKNFSSALTKFRSGKRYQKIRDKMNMVGSIRDFEVTYSDSNGFHPHIHLAIFYLNNIDLNLIKKEMFELWEKACNKFGLSTKENIGLDIQNGDSVEEYLSKHGTWSLEQELSKSHIKTGKKGSLTPFDFLKEYLNTENERYLKLFQEYAEAFKGKTQLFWSRGLKRRFLIGEKSDEELAKEKLEDADLLGLITYEDWKIIVRYDLRSDLLSLIEKYGFDFALHTTMKKWKKEKESSLQEDSRIFAEI